MNLPLVASHEIHYLNDKDEELQRLMTAIRLNRPIREVDPSETAAAHASFLTPAEMDQRFQAYPQALRNSVRIAERCQFRLPLGKTHFPVPALALRRKRRFSAA